MYITSHVLDLLSDLRFVHRPFSLFELRHKKPGFLPIRKQSRRSAVSAFAFATRIVLFIFYLYPKFQASSFML